MALAIVPRPSVREQLALLEARRLQYQRAALQAKRGQDLEQAKAHLRVAKRLEAQITQVRAGRPVDLSKVSLASVSSRTSQAGEALAGLMGGARNEAAAWWGQGADRMRGHLGKSCCLCCSAPWSQRRPGGQRG